MKMPSPLSLRQWKRPGLALGLLLAVLTTVLYSAPSHRSGGMDGAHLDLPVSMGADLYLYLNFSALSHGDKTIINPWYGTEMPYGEAAYTQFDLAFRGFSLLWHLLGERWVASVQIWNAFFTLLIFITAMALWAVLLPDKSIPFLALGATFLCLFDLTATREVLAAWDALPALEGFTTLNFPFFRPFFPQVVSPLLFAYLALQINALTTPQSWPPWLGMALIQWLVLATFPYLTLLLAAITSLTLLVLLAADSTRIHWPAVLSFGLMSAFLDLSFMFLKGSGTWARPGGGSPWQFSPAGFTGAVGGVTILLCLLILLIFASKRAMKLEIWSTLLGFGLATEVLLFSDLFISPLLQISVHIGYFTPATLGILVVFLGSRLLPNDRVWAKYAMGTALCLLLTHGALVAYGKTLRTRSLDAAVVDQARLLNSVQTTEHDLVILPARFVDQGTWVPLVSTAEVLFVRMGEFLLRPSDIGIHRQRQALHLYLSGWTSSHIEVMLAKPESATAADWNLVMRIDDYWLQKMDRARLNESIRTELLPFLQRFEASDGAAAEQILSQYKRILVLDAVDSPVFDVKRLQHLLEFRDEMRGDSFILTIAVPR